MKSTKGNSTPEQKKRAAEAARKRYLASVYAFNISARVTEHDRKCMNAALADWLVIRNPEGAKALRGA